MMKRNDTSTNTTCGEGRLGTIWAALRQWRFHSEFRIEPPIYPREFQTILNELIRASESPTSASGQPSTEHANSRVLARFLAEVGTNLWRLRLKMLQPGTDQPLEDMRRPYRHVQSMWDTLTQEGVDIHDHTGEIVPEGGVYGLKVLASQPTPGVGREMVLETIRPTIRYRKQTIQMGEVILAKPDNSPNEITAEPAAVRKDDTIPPA
ncbi:MAG: hypothetical protein ABSG68_11695 [Thermoguttaceae bacterium]|jgi:hypothetical protein